MAVRLESRRFVKEDRKIATMALQFLSDQRHMVCQRR